MQNGTRLHLPSVITSAAELQRVPVDARTSAAVSEFITRRLEQLLLDDGAAPEAVKAVLGERGPDPALAATTAADLQVGAAKAMQVLTSPPSCLLLSSTGCGNEVGTQMHCSLNH